jgi:tRNA modification GTPase
MTEVTSNKATYVTQFTAEASGAIAVLRIWGGDATGIADRLFRPKYGHRGLAQSQPGELRLGWFGIDEVVALVIPADSGDLEVEIQGHGSPILIKSILQSLKENNVTAINQDQYLKAHGVLWLERKARDHFNRVNAPKAAEVLWRQVNGSLRRTLERIQADLKDGQKESSIDLIDRLLMTAHWGTCLSRGFTVALAGAPNVGKSTLVNALAGFERVLVSPIAGTTRDLVDVCLTINGWPLVVTDMAGLRDETTDLLEASGIALARGRQNVADLVVRLYGPDEIEMAKTGSGNDLVVFTKQDLMEETAVPEGMIAISARSGQGLELFMAQMIERLIPEDHSDERLTGAVICDLEIESALREVRRLVNGEQSTDFASRYLSELLHK